MTATTLRRLLTGPEIWWLVVYGATLLLGATNVPPTVEGNQRLEAVGWLWGPGAVLLSFLTLLWLPGGRWWALLRVFLSGCVGVSFVTTTLRGAMIYNDSRDSGVGTAWMMFIMFGWMTLGAASVIAAFVIAVRRSQTATSPR